jgi:inorganic pyrophosphatase
MKSIFEQIPPFDEEEKQWRVIIETPQGSHNKYKLNPRLGLFELAKVLPEGMFFPYDFGYLPATQGDDGDPLDVLLLMDKPAFCGCLIPSRLIGVIEATQSEKGEKPQRNDRLVAVPIKGRTYSDCQSLKDLNKDRLKEIEEFFVSYNRIAGKKFEVVSVSGPKRAESLARKGMARYSKGKKG